MKTHKWSETKDQLTPERVERVTTMVEQMKESLNMSFNTRFEKLVSILESEYGTSEEVYYYLLHALDLSSPTDKQSFALTLLSRNVQATDGYFYLEDQYSEELHAEFDELLGEDWRTEGSYDSDEVDDDESDDDTVSLTTIVENDQAQPTVVDKENDAISDESSDEVLEEEVDEEIV